MTDLPYITIQTVAPGGKRYRSGAVEISHYKVVDDGKVVCLCTAKGAATSKRRVLQDGETPKEGAVQLLRAKIRGDRADRPKGFGRPLRYGDPVKY